jgi:hypothetical protein
MHVKCAARGAAGGLRTLFFLLISSLFLALPILRSHAQFSQPMASGTRSDEFDTADRQGGQVGGTLMGIGYRLMALRCGSGQAIVGANIRRSDALDYLQITCAAPSCANGSCTWSSPHPGMAAGSPYRGVAHPAMMCQSDEVVSGIRGRVAIFAERTGFDYASDLEIECSQMTSASVTGRSGEKFYPVTRGGAGSWHHPDGGFASAAQGVAHTVSKSSVTPPISCRPGGYGATSISVGISNFLGSANQPVVQAVSLFCPRIAPTAPQQPPQNIAGTSGRSQKPRTGPTGPQQSPAVTAATSGRSQKSAAVSTTPQQTLPPQQIASNTIDFKLMTPDDSMWTNSNYAGILGYFPATSNTRSSCHGFVGEMGISTPGSDVCGDGYLKNLAKLPAGTPHQLGDVAAVYGRGVVLHTAIYLGCSLYLQRKGTSDIQVSQESYIDNFASNEQVIFLRPGGLGTFSAKLAVLKAKIDPNDGTNAAHQALIAQIQGCFPN